MCVPHSYISFIIECECNELVESEIHIPKMKKSKSGQYFINGETTYESVLGKYA